MAFLANQFSLKNYDVHLLTYENNEIVQFLAPGVHHVDFHYSPPRVFALRRILQIIQVKKVIARIKPDVLISFLAYPNIISIISTGGTRIPVIISERGDPYSETGWFTSIKNFFYNFADGYVFQTQRAKNYYSKKIQEKAIVISNPVVATENPAEWSSEDQEDFIVNVGRLELKQKRQDVLISAFSKIAFKHPNLKLVLYGDGTDESKIKKIIADCNLENRVILAGVTHNVYAAIKTAKMFVLTSDYEGIPNALIEAMTVGLPCISTDCSPGGAAELIKNMENGILVKVGDVDELANAMEFVLNYPQKAKEMGQRARKIIDDLDPEAITLQWENFINTSIAAKPLKEKKWSV